MNDDDIAGLLPGDEGTPEGTVELAAAIGKVLHDQDAEAVLWALTLVVADVVRQGSGDDLGEARQLFAGFCWNLHQGIQGLAGAISSTGGALDLTEGRRGLSEAERAAAVVATVLFSNLFAGLAVSTTGNVVLSGALSAAVGMVCSVGDERPAKRFATILRRIAKAMPETRAQIVEAREAAEREAALFAGRATVGDVGRA